MTQDEKFLENEKRKDELIKKKKKRTTISASTNKGTIFVVF